MTSSIRCFLIAFVLSLILVACSEPKQEPAPAVEAPKAEPAPAAKPEAVAEKKEEAGPPWALAPQPVPGKEGDTMFAVAPIGKEWNIVGFKLGTLENVKETTCTFNKNSLVKHPNVPGAILFPVPQNETYKAGDVVFGDVYATARPARVEKVEGQTLFTKTEWIRAVKDIKMTAGKNVKKLPVGLEPMALVAYPNMGGTYLGTVGVVQNDTVWVIAQSGHMKDVKKDTVFPLDPNPKYKEGDAVFATWGGGKFFPAKIKAVMQDGLLYEVSYISDNPALKKPEIKAFWEVTKSIGEKK